MTGACQYKITNKKKPVLVLDLALALGLGLDEKYGEELGRGMWRLKFDADSRFLLELPHTLYTTSQPFVNVFSTNTSSSS